jgi:hypothetical protein
MQDSSSTSPQPAAVARSVLHSAQSSRHAHKRSAVDVCVVLLQKIAS